MTPSQRWLERAKPPMTDANESEKPEWLHAGLPKRVMSELSISKDGLFFRCYYTIIAPEAEIQDVFHERSRRSR
jgi:hypothetical protein